MAVYYGHHDIHFWEIYGRITTPNLWQSKIKNNVYVVEYYVNIKVETMSLYFFNFRIASIPNQVNDCQQTVALCTYVWPQSVCRLYE